MELIETKTETEANQALMGTNKPWIQAEVGWGWEGEEPGVGGAEPGVGGEEPGVGGAGTGPGGNQGVGWNRVCWGGAGDNWNH